MGYAGVCNSPASKRCLHLAGHCLQKPKGLRFRHQAALQTALRTALRWQHAAFGVGWMMRLPSFQDVETGLPRSLKPSQVWSPSRFDFPRSFKSIQDLPTEDFPELKTFQGLKFDSSSFSSQFSTSPAHSLGTPRKPSTGGRSAPNAWHVWLTGDVGAKKWKETAQGLNQKTQEKCI